jgi:hypothetical protein
MLLTTSSEPVLFRNRSLQQQADGLREFRNFKHTTNTTEHGLDRVEAGV